MQSESKIALKTVEEDSRMQNMRTNDLALTVSRDDRCTPNGFDIRVVVHAGREKPLCSGLAVAV